MKNSLNIMLLYGGISAEREISIITAKAISESLNNIGHNVIEIDAGINLAVDLNKYKPDLVFNGLHGTWGEDGEVQKIIERFKIPYTHSGVEASQIAMDKIKSAEIFNKNNFFHPKTYLIKINEINKQNFFEYPFVLKPRSEGSSVGVGIIRSESDKENYIQENMFRKEVLIQQFIKGPEINVAIFGNNKTGSLEIDPKNEFYDYESKYFDKGQTKHIIPPRLNDDQIKEVEKLALKAHHLIGCKGISRIEFILDSSSKQFYILELNTQPGMTPTSLVPEIAKYHGVNFDDLIKWMIEDAK